MLAWIYSEPRVEESVIYLSDFKLNAAGRDFAKFGATGRSTLFATTSRDLKYENGLSNVVNDKGRYHSRCHLKDRLPAERRLSLKIEFLAGVQDSGHLLKRALIGF